MERAGRLIGKLKLSPTVSTPEDRAKAAWQVAAGKKIAEHTRAVSLVRSTLLVEVGDITWQRQLNTLRHFLLRNLKDVLGEVVVTEIDFRPLPKNAAPIGTPRMAPGRAASATGLHDEDATERIEDPVLSLLYRKSRSRQLAPGQPQTRNRNTA